MANNSGITTIDEFPSVGGGDFGLDPDNKEGQEGDKNLPNTGDTPNEDIEDKDGVDPKEVDDNDKKGNSDKEGDEDFSGEDGDNKSGDDAAEYFEDEDGNIIDKAGEIIVKKDDVKKDENGNVIIPDTENSQVNKISESVATKFGIELKDDDGNPKKYEDTDEGIALLVEDIAGKVVEAKEGALFEEFPQLAEYHNHLLAGGKPENYFKHIETTSDAKYTIPADDLKDEKSNLTRKAIIREEQLIKNGYYDTADTAERSLISERAKKYVDRVFDSGEEEFVAEAKYAKDSIDKINEKRRNEKLEQDKAVIADRQAKVDQYVNSIKSTVKSRKLHSITIPESEIEAFTNYLTKPVNPQGQTQEMLDVGQEDLAKSLEIAYSRFKGFDLDAIVKLRVGAEKAKALRLRKAKPVTIGGGKRAKKGGKVDLDDITLDNLLG